MSSIVVFGAGGRAGRLVVSEARGRGHAVTAVVRDPARRTVAATPDLHVDGVTLVAGDASDPDRVAAVAAGHDAAISTIPPRYDVAPERDELALVHAALLDGLARAGVGRLLVVGVAPTLEVAPGVRMLNAPDRFSLPPAHMPFLRAHAAGLDALIASDGPVSWVSFTPPMQCYPHLPRVGRYRVWPGDALPTQAGTDELSYADLAIALVDEAERPRHDRTRVAVTG